ncbi:flagellar type III secretion system pore protein FliP [Acetohalobium arabaticum]|uniref:Flagellar biosynthetic protein FliP n=1 Tax=Acetohalobium arabaticum (strain ATCC 49924 / DSM 5501 / Z-7288) TaxID=574087 RepID=D9QRJ3_ACEAZ|nr:flagellar type III secretion system pore protein FliP [Acetohalobium arabaticum]ADL13134.1 flagellar biosynthetic protein FliP [Acetohalobium arabaticum DSM 5501]
MINKRWKFIFKVSILLLLIIISSQGIVEAAPTFEIPDVNLSIETGEGSQNLALPLQIMLLLTVLSLAPAILIMLTSFVRIAVVLSLIRRALATRRMPPNQVIIGLAIFLTIFVMAPVWGQIYDTAVQPYLDDEINQMQAYEQGIKPLRKFMFKQTREKDIALFVDLGEIERPQNQMEIPTYVLIPAFIISELRIAFQIGFIIYLPFIVIDMIVASTLMSMGMMMLPPVMISLPFKILLFVLVDGWYLVIKSLIKTFN